MKTLEINSPLMGSISQLFIENGVTVHEGEKLLAVECMKMQYDIETPYAGVLQIKVELGDIVGEGDLLATIDVED